jgi:hypothetical protein
MSKEVTYHVHGDADESISKEVKSCVYEFVVYISYI